MDSAHTRVTRIDSSRRIGLPTLAGESWRYRELLWVLAERDIKVRYKQTVLGAAWAVLQPVLTMLIFALIFGRLAKMPSDGIPYTVYVFSALVPWTLFANSITTASSSVLASNLINKVYFPRILIPISSSIVFILDACIASVVLLAFAAWFEFYPSLRLFWLPFVFAGLALSAMGVGLMLSALVVSYRDFRFVTPFLVQLWMFVTPVVYPASLVPDAWRWGLGLNPAAGFIEATRWVFLGTPLNMSILLLSMATSTLLFAVGLNYFRNVERRFADIA